MGSAGRNFVLANINGKIIPFYRSSKGTDGKIKGDWYPFFGNTGNWLVKGSISSDGKMSYSKEIDKVTKLLNDNLKLPEYDVNGASLSIEIPGITGYGVSKMFPGYGPFRGGLSYYDEVANTPRRNRAETPLSRNKLIDGLFVERITGIDASDVVNGPSSGNWRSGRQHIDSILRELATNRSGGQLKYQHLRK